MKRTNRFFGIAVLATMILATTVLNGCGCDNNKATPDSAVATVDETTENTNETNTTATYADGTTIAAESANTNATAGNNKTATTANGTAVQNDKNKTTANGNNQNTNNSAESKNTNSGNNNTNNGNNTGTNKSNSANTNNSGNGKTWHDAVYEDIYHPAETKQVKVVDKEAYSYEEPVYKQVPVYRTKYDYDIGRWKHLRDLTTEGYDKENVYWPSTDVPTSVSFPSYGDERQGSKSETYNIVVIDEEGDTQNVSSTYSRWIETNVGDEIYYKTFRFSHTPITKIS